MRKVKRRTYIELYLCLEGYNDEHLYLKNHYELIAHKEFVKRLSLPDNLMINLKKYGDYDASVKLINRKNKKDWVIISKIHKSINFIPEKFLKISIRGPIYYELADIDKKDPVTFKNVTDYITLDIIQCFIEQICDFIILHSIANPGRLIVRNGYLFCDDDFISIFPSMQSKIIFDLSKEEQDAELLAIAILLASFQKLIIEDRDELVFSEYYA